MGNAVARNPQGAVDQNPQFVEIVEIILERVKTVLDQFEGLIFEILRLFGMFRDLYEEIRDIVTLNVRNEFAEYEVA